MPRSTLPWVLAVLSLGACQRSSEGQPLVTAPVASGAPAAADASVAPAASASAAPSASAGDAGAPGPDPGAAPPQFAACQSDADCVAVPRVGCCHNGYLAAVNVAQKDAYASSFTCPQAHPICPMFIVRDTRVARCDAAQKLCVLVQP